MDGWEFPIRIGRNEDEGKLLLEKVKNAIEMLSTAKSDNGIELKMSQDEKLILNNSLNEVASGFHIENYEDRIGDAKGNVRLFLAEINKALNTMEILS